MTAADWSADHSAARRSYLAAHDSETRIAVRSLLIGENAAGLLEARSEAAVDVIERHVLRTQPIWLAEHGELASDTAQGHYESSFDRHVRELYKLAPPEPEPVPPPVGAGDGTPDEPREQPAPADRAPGMSDAEPHASGCDDDRPSPEPESSPDRSPGQVPIGIDDRAHENDREPDGGPGDGQPTIVVEGWVGHDAEPLDLLPDRGTGR